MRSKTEIVGVRFVQILLFTLSLWVVETVLSGLMGFLLGILENAQKIGLSKPMTWLVVFFKEVYEYGLIRGLLDIFSINWIRLGFYYPFYLPLFTLAIYMRALPPM